MSEADSLDAKGDASLEEIKKKYKTLYLRTGRLENHRTEIMGQFMTRYLCITASFDNMIICM